MSGFSLEHSVAGGVARSDPVWPHEGVKLVPHEMESSVAVTCTVKPGVAPETLKVIVRVSAGIGCACVVGRDRLVVLAKCDLHISHIRLDCRRSHLSIAEVTSLTGLLSTEGQISQADSERAELAVARPPIHRSPMCRKGTRRRQRRRIVARSDGVGLHPHDGFGQHDASR